MQMGQMCSQHYYASIVREDILEQERNIFFHALPNHLPPPLRAMSERIFLSQGCVPNTVTVMAFVPLSYQPPIHPSYRDILSQIWRERKFQFSLQIRTASKSVSVQSIFASNCKIPKQMIKTSNYIQTRRLFCNTFNSDKSATCTESCNSCQ